MSYSNNPNSIVAGSGITVTPTTGTGANKITISTSGTVVNAVRIATVSPVVVTNADDVVSVQLLVTGPAAVTLPVGVAGRTFTIKDGLGASAVNAITITPAGVQTIDLAATATINSNFGAVTLVFDGVSNWLIV